jgi:DNA-binding transcriptional ArsR family regulator
MSSIFPLRETVTLDDDREPRLVEIDEDTADEVFEALSSGTTRKIFLELHKAPQTASDLADVTETSVQNVQYHLNKLLDADLIEVVDTWYSERGSEMKVYAPQDESLVLFAGRDKQRSLRSLLSRVVGVLGMLVPASVLAAWFTGRNAIEGLFGDGGPTGGGAPATGDPSPTPEDGSATTDGGAENGGATEERDVSDGADANGAADGGADMDGDATANGGDEPNGGGDDMGTSETDGGDGANADGVDAETTSFQGGDQSHEVSVEANTTGEDLAERAGTDGTTAEFECSDVTVTADDGTITEFECSDVTVTTDSNDTAANLVTDGGQMTPESLDGAADTAASIDPALAAGLAFFVGGLFVFTAIVMWYGTPDSW